jgi:hypothetical protein
MAHIVHLHLGEDASWFSQQFSTVSLELYELENSAVVSIRSLSPDIHDLVRFLKTSRIS